MFLVPWRFYEELSSFTRRMNQLFDRFFGEEFFEGIEEKLSFPPLRIGESKQSIIINLKAPGFSHQDLEVYFEKNLLLIKGEKKKNNKDKYPQMEITSFKKSIRMPENIQLDSVEAKFKDGELIIFLPKLKEAKSSFRVAIE